MTQQRVRRQTARDDRQSSARRRSRARRPLGLLLIAGLLIAACFVSLCVGSNPIPFDEVWRLLWQPDGSYEAVVIHEQRVPRTLLVVVVGAALGVAGALMQSLTRNPLADPGILGVNAGASLAVVLSVAVFGITSVWFTMWFAFAGAAIATLAVSVLGGVGRQSASPARLALAGVAISMAIAALVQTVILSNQQVYNEFRFWAAGSAEARGYDVLVAVIGFIAVGVLLAQLTAPALNALSLGVETGRALGVRVVRVRVLVLIAITLLAGAATAAVGPIMFVGLGVPYIARAVCGPDQRWVVPASVLAAPVVLLIADILARIVVAPQEIQVGVMSAILGGPVFIALVRRRRIEAL